MDFDERGEFEDNRKEKREKFKSRREKTEKDIRSTQDGTIKLGSIGESKEAIDWKVLIRREIEESETIWSQRRSIAENNYAYRLEENDIEDKTPEEQYEIYKKQGLEKKEIIKIIAKNKKVSKNEIYQLFIEK